MGVDCLEFSGSELLQQIGGIDGPGPKPVWLGSLLEVKDNSPAVVPNGLFCELALVNFVGVFCR